jgi:hypothetical protein
VSGTGMGEENYRRGLEPPRTVMPEEEEEAEE